MILLILVGVGCHAATGVGDRSRNYPGVNSVKAVVVNGTSNFN